MTTNSAMRGLGLLAPPAVLVVLSLSACVRENSQDASTSRAGMSSDKHRTFTELAITHYAGSIASGIVDAPDLTDPANLAALARGAKQEDEDALGLKLLSLRPINHFYDCAHQAENGAGGRFRYDKGTAPFETAGKMWVSAKAWANSTQDVEWTPHEIARLGTFLLIPMPEPSWLALELNLPTVDSKADLYGGSYTWDEALAAYAAGDTETALETLGHILHLVEDMTIPAHTRNDLHAPGWWPSSNPLAPVHLVRSWIPEYESWLDERNAAPSFSGPPFEFNSLDDAFDRLSQFTQGFAFSGGALTGTVPTFLPSSSQQSTVATGYPGPVVESRGFRWWGGELWYVAEAHDPELASDYPIAVLTLGGWSAEHPIVYEANWNRLSLVAGQAVAGVTRLFLEEAAAQQLAIRTEPSAAIPDQPLAPSPAVEARDRRGNVVTTASGFVTARLASGTGGLWGALTVPLVDGVATFSDLRIAGLGTFTLAFMKPGFAEVVSRPFAVGATPLLGTPTTLSAIPTGLCWFSTPMHAVFTNAAGTTWIASGEHRYCDTHVDAVAVYSRPAGGAWSSARPLTYAYAGGSVDQSWFNGMPGTLSMAQSSTGAPHVLVNIRKAYGSTGWGPDRSTYLRQVGGAWQATADVVSDEALQIADGNSGGAQYSGYPFSLVADPSTDVLHLFGYDGAWSATRYHAITSSAAAGSGTWSAMASAYTSTGAVDRGSVLGASQDIRGGVGVQVWLSPPTCSLLGRRYSGGSWGATSIGEPLGFASCSSSSSAYWGINMSSEALVSANGVPTLFAAGQPRVSGSPVTLARMTPSGGTWTRTSTTIPTWSVASDGHWRAFDDASGRQYIVHSGATAGTIMLYDVATGQDSLLYTGATGSSIGFVDAERHGPRVLVWAESSGSTWTLKVADLVLP